jgi:hypothetical protein
VSEWWLALAGRRNKSSSEGDFDLLNQDKIEFEEEDSQPVKVDTNAHTN